MNDHWEMRLKNLLWTVSGDYSLEMSFEDDKWEETPWAALYDAVKEGAYVRYCSQTFREEVSLYLLKKIYLGAEEGTLVQAAGLCIDSMAGSRILAERPGAEMIRRRAYEELMDVRFDSLVKSDLGRLSLLWMRASLDGNALAERRLTEHLEHLKTLAKEQGIENREEDTAGEIAKQEEHGENGKAGQSENVRTFLETLDQIYNRLADPAFEKKRGGLDAVLSVTMEELQEFNWQDFLDEEALEQTLEAYRNQLDSRITETEHSNSRRDSGSGGTSIVQVSEEELKKRKEYTARNFGPSYMTKEEEKRREKILCRDVHADSALYYTEGILQAPLVKNYQYQYIRRQTEVNRTYYRRHYTMSRKNIGQLVETLQKALIRRTEPEISVGDTGSVLPGLLWKVGRVQTDRIFERRERQEPLNFVIDILIDASGSQRKRQSQVALQAFIISEALSRLQIPHRVMSFCSFWNTTVLHRFRDYEDPPEKNGNIFELYASSNNRDGLAIRAAAYDLMQRPQEGKVLVVLSDGRPNDKILYRAKGQEPDPRIPVYGDAYAVKDTAYEVRKIRAQGVRVLGVFTGEEADLQAERKIFGKDFAYIRDASVFAHTVGRYMKQLLEDL